MRKLVFGLFFLCVCGSTSAIADQSTNRLGGLIVPTINTYNWGPKVNNDIFQISSNTASQIDANTFTASQTVNASVLISVIGGSSQALVVKGSSTIDNLTISQITGQTQCLQANSSGLISGTGGSCGGGGSGTAVAIANGGSGVPVPIVSSPTAIVNVDSRTITAVLQGGATAFLSLNPSSVTLQGQQVVSAVNVGVGLSGGGSGPGPVTVSLTTPVSIANGGTSTNTFTANQGVYYNGTSLVSNAQEGVNPSSVTFAGAGGVGVTYGVSAGSFTATGLTSGQCVQTGAGGLLVGTGAACLTAQASSSLAVTTGSASGFQSVASSPTAIVNFDSSTFLVSLKGGATAFVQISTSSPNLPFIWNTNTLQSGSTFYTSSGTVQNLNVTNNLQIFGTSSSASPIATITPANNLNGLSINPTGTGVGLAINKAGGSGAMSTFSTDSSTSAYFSTATGIAGRFAATNGGNAIQIDKGNLQFPDGTKQTSASNSSNVILNQNTLQSGATFYVSSGTVINLTVSTATVSSATITTLNITNGANNGILLQPGTFNNTAIGFLGDVNTGLYEQSAGIGWLVASGLQKLQWNSNGVSVVNGVFGAPNGSASAPGIAWGSPGNSGLYQITQADLGIATNGTKAIEIGPLQNVIVSSQLIVNSSFTVTDSTTNAYEATFSTTSTVYHVAISTSGHFITGGQSPSMGACGTGTPSISGDDNEGIVTTGTGGPTLCNLVFANTWGSAATPVCNATYDNAAVTPALYSVNSSSVTFNLGAGLTSGHIHYRCGCSGSSCR